MRLTWPSLVVLTAINIVGFVAFLLGFFPSKVILPGYNDQPLTDVRSPFNKVVFMVVDALRSDFLFSEESNFDFVHQLINDGAAVPFTAYSSPPTVTLPRLKGLTLGSTPVFLDAILNIADDKDQSQGLLGQDNWLWQLRRKFEGDINFYGDDTWLKLFPNFFNNTDGTNSFFVNDFVEVDTNVTRHLDTELSQKSSWDGLFLHYLGLDHIGHKTGPHSAFMVDKQKEMDSIIKRVYNFITSSKSHKDTLFVVLGDHGMNEIGNHGGASAGETNPGLLFISPKFKSLNLQLKAPVPIHELFGYFSYVNQMDIVPTLSLLLGFPIPKNSVGIVIETFLNLFPKKVHSQILSRNYDQLHKLTTLLATAEKIKVEFLHEIQGKLVENSTNYNYPYIYTGIGLAIFVMSINVYYFWKYCRSINVNALPFVIGSVIYSFHFHGSSLIEEEHHIWWLAAVLVLVYFIIDLRASASSIMILICLRALYGWCNHGQKYVSEFTFSEFLKANPTVLWSLNVLLYTVLGFLIFYQGSLRYVTNPTLKYGEDKSDIFNIYSFLLVFMVASLSFEFKALQAVTDGSSIPRFIDQIVFLNIREGDGLLNTNELLIRFANWTSWGILVLSVIRLLVKSIRSFNFGTLTDLVNLFTLFLVTNTKTELMPMFLLFLIMKRCLVNLISLNSKSKNLEASLVKLFITVFIWTHLSFFCMGGTNSLATVDLSNSYNGLNSYQIEWVAILTFISNFSGPIFWSVNLPSIVFEPSLLKLRRPPSDVTKWADDLVNFKLPLMLDIWRFKLFFNLTFYSISCVNLIASCFNLRFHLFIWTVFLPKLLYFGVWFLFMNVFIDTLLCGLFIFLSGRK